MGIPALESYSTGTHKLTVAVDVVFYSKLFYIQASSLFKNSAVATELTVHVCGDHAITFVRNGGSTTTVGYNLEIPALVGWYTLAMNIEIVNSKLTECPTDHYEYQMVG